MVDTRIDRDDMKNKLTDSKGPQWSMLCGPDCTSCSHSFQIILPTMLLEPSGDQLDRKLTWGSVVTGWTRDTSDTHSFSFVTLLTRALCSLLDQEHLSSPCAPFPWCLQGQRSYWLGDLRLAFLMDFCFSWIPQNSWHIHEAEAGSLSRQQQLQFPKSIRHSGLGLHGSFPLLPWLHWNLVNMKPCL